MEDVDMQNADIYSEFRLRVVDGKERFLCLLEPCGRLARSYAGKQSWILHRLRIHKIDDTRNIPDIRVIRKWFGDRNPGSNDKPAISATSKDAAKQSKSRLAATVNQSKSPDLAQVTSRSPSASLREKLPKRIVSGSAPVPADRSVLTQQTTNQTLDVVHTSIQCMYVVRTVADLLIKGLLADYLNLAHSENGRQRTLRRETNAFSEVTSIAPPVDRDGLQHALGSVRGQSKGKKSISEIFRLFEEEMASNPELVGEDNCDCATCVRDFGKLDIK
ncbi:uncharacterized protein [Physcomitrium patens]|nr:uncharacterized protein LOC112284277 isoform X1 [Physcomitrium patens]|eukprot:XP_024379725.1 uncharacterized protein LOC112284277 isoform X1 [Physcomitrella patens]